MGLTPAVIRPLQMIPLCKLCVCIILGMRAGNNVRPDDVRPQAVGPSGPDHALRSAGHAQDHEGPHSNGGRRLGRVQSIHGEIPKN